MTPLGSATVIHGNALDLPLEDNSVDLVVTSPPYFGLRSYSDNGEHYQGQLGSEATPAEFVDALLAATREMMRVVKPSGSIFVNLGDKYVSRQSGYDQTDGGSWAKIHGETGDDRANGEKVAHARGERTRSHYLTEQTGIRQKSLMGIPWRYALACIDDLGLILRAEIIWSKPNGLPESVTDRVRRSHEQWFHYTLQPRYFSAVDEIRESYTESSYERSKYATDKAMTGRMKGSPTDKRDQATPGWQPSTLGKLPGSVWTVPTQPLTVPPTLGVDHFAAFPSEWPKRIIQGWSPAAICVGCGEGRRPVTQRESPGDFGPRITERNGQRQGQGPTGNGLNVQPTVITGYVCACPDTSAPTTPSTILDPFGGTGTTALVAKALGRHGISVDLSTDYCRIAEWRTQDRNQLAHVLDMEKAPAADPDQLDLFADGVTA